MSIISTISEFARKNSLFTGKSLIVGCSGGSDSVALLRILREITDSDIYVVHVNHGLRGQDANLDEQFVVELCDKLNIPCKVYGFDVKREAEYLKRSLEDTGRILRYRAFEDYQRELFGDDYLDKSVVCLAHHKDDVAETMLMNLFRGSGIEGLITPKPKTATVIRPLLCVTKSELIDYLKEINQDYRVDDTNFELDCTRNKWRNSIIPMINSVSNKNASDALFSTYELISDDADYLSQESEKVYSEITEVDTKTIDVDALSKTHKSIMSRVIRMLWLETFGDLIDLERTHVDNIIDLFSSTKSSGSTIDLPFNRLAYVIDGRGGFCSKDDFDEVGMRLFANKGFVFCEKDISFGLYEMSEKHSLLPHLKRVLSVQIVENCNDLVYNSNSWFYPIFEDSDGEELVFGQVDNDLQFGKAGSSSHKKIGRLLMDKKLPLGIRDRVAGVYVGEEVLWIPGIGHSKGFVDEVSMGKFFETLEGVKRPIKYLCVRIDLSEDCNG
ncbi:MAG: tRNA lysidine(34) synthetase TilS [Clostridia bacterium]|nr:tRNA lysidine(34) synthetase TilS [Clostridia bacterium]